MDIFIAWNDDPNNRWPCRFVEWSDFFEFVSDREEIELRVDYGVEIDPPEGDQWNPSWVPLGMIAHMYDEWQQNRTDDARGEHAERSAYMQGRGI